MTVVLNAYVKYKMDSCKCPVKSHLWEIIICPGFYMDKYGMYISKVNSTAQNCAGIKYTIYVPHYMFAFTFGVFFL